MPEKREGLFPLDQRYPIFVYYTIEQFLSVYGLGCLIFNCFKYGEILSGDNMWTLEY